MNLIDKITKHTNEKEAERDNRPKTSFWPSETETDVFDIYHKWIGTKVTDPIDALNIQMFNVANLIEKSYTDLFDELNILNGSQVRIEMERFGVSVTGYIDCMIYDTDDTAKIVRAKQLAKKIGNGVEKEELLELAGDSTKIMPVEIKSFYGDYQEKDLEKGNVKENYVKQLSIYLDYLNLEKGILFYINRGNGKLYEFEVNKINTWKYQCNSIVVDLEEVYKKWARLYFKNIVPRVEPKPEYTYKYPIDKIDFKKLSTSVISNMRNGSKVHGDWQARYSNYFQLHLKKEKTVEGYTKQEMDKIIEKTKGYTSKTFKN